MQESISLWRQDVRQEILSEITAWPCRRNDPSAFEDGATQRPVAIFGWLRHLLDMPTSLPNAEVESWALHRIGRERLEGLVSAMELVQYVKRPLPGYRLGDGELFRHSLNVAEAARGAASALGYPAPEQAYAAALMHDVGKVVLDAHVSSETDRVMHLIWKHRRRLCQVESALLGIDHPSAGALLAWRWGLPEEIVQAVRGHHHPGKDLLAAIVNLSHALFPQGRVGLSSMGYQTAPLEAIRALGLSMAEMGRLRSVVAGVMERARPGG